MILDAAAALLAEGGIQSAGFPQIAERAGVSVRTVYRNFPTQAALLEALGEWVDVQMGHQRTPRTVDDIANIVETLFPAFDEHALMVQAQLVNPIWQEVRARARKRRASAVRSLVLEVGDNLPEEEVVRAAGVIKYLFSADAWSALRRDFDLDGVEAGKAVSWAIRALVADLKRRNVRAGAK